MSLASTAQLSADLESTDTAKIGALPAILEAIKQWEAARLAEAFPEDIKILLRDNEREFHLEATGLGKWYLYMNQSGRLGKPVEVIAKRHEFNRC